MKAKNITHIIISQKVIFFILLLFTFTASTFQQKYNVKNSVYWLYPRNGKTYKQLHQAAAKEGVKIDTQHPKLTFKVILSEKQYFDLKSKFPLQIVWNKYSRAKLSLFTSKKIEYNDILVFKNKTDKKYYYVLACTLDNIMRGTWQVTISDVNNNTLKFAQKDKFDVIVL